MKVVLIYESMFGATRSVAEAIAEGMRTSADVVVRRASDTGPFTLDWADLVVVGAPTQAWSMPRPRTRKGTPGYVRKRCSGLVLEPGAQIESGVREFLASLPSLRISAAAFDTRIKAPRLFTGRASKAIGRALARRGARLVVPPESFLVDRKSHLIPTESERVRAWGAHVVMESSSREMAAT